MGIFDKLTSMMSQWAGKTPPIRSADLHFQVGHRCEIGNFRDNNEDRLFVGEEGRLVVVADGMGGQAAGEQASQLAIEIVPSRLSEFPGEVFDPPEVRKAVREAILAANEAIVRKGDSDPSTQNMGTTIVMGYCRSSRMYIAHIGDSRAYLIRDGKVQRITTDHNLAQALYEAKTISEDELDTHRFRHVLWKYLGSKEVGDGPDMTEIDVQPGDRFLFASDGLTGSVTDPEILRMFESEPNPQHCAEHLVRLALDNGSRDNVSCVVLYSEGAAKPPEEEVPPTSVSD